MFVYEKSRLSKSVNVVSRMSVVIISFNAIDRYDFFVVESIVLSACVTRVDREVDRKYLGGP